MYKILMSVLLMFGFISCQNAPNEFTPEANKFLETINNKEYQGQGSFSTSTFKVNNTVIAEYRSDNQKTIALKFQKTRNNNTSITEGIYKEIRGTLYYGIIISDNGRILGRTKASESEESINWDDAPTFAIQK